jgi:GntR family transcriptional regulator
MSELALPGTINRESPIPFYFQLAELLEDEISSGRWAAGQRIPSEPDLCDHYGVSRTTVRQALSRLEQEGLVARSKGRGTFVLGGRPRSWLIQTTEGFFHEEFVRTGHRVTSKILRRERAALPNWAADALDLPHESQGIILERLRAVDGLVALYVLNYLPDRLAEIVLGMKDPHESLYRRMVGKGAVTIAGGRRSVEAVNAGERLASLLEVDPQTALAYIESVSWDDDLRPFDCYQAWLRTDRMQLDIMVTSASRGGVQFPGLYTDGDEVDRPDEGGPAAVEGSTASQ